MTAIHTPYDPESVPGDVGWLWLDDGPMGPDWHLVRTDYDEDGDIWVTMIGEVEEDYTPTVKADRHRGAPYLSALKPAAEPGTSDALEVTIRFASGASAAHSFGDPEAAARVEAAVLQALAMGRGDG